jgi:hypothetical protein
MFAGNTSLHTSSSLVTLFAVLWAQQGAVARAAAGMGSCLSVAAVELAHTHFFSTTDSPLERWAGLCERCERSAGEHCPYFYTYALCQGNTKCTPVSLIYALRSALSYS